jgi:HK97 family phage major capsid protein
MRQLALIAAMSSAAIAIPMTATERAAGRYMRDGTGHNAAGDGRRELSPEEIALELRKSFDERTGKVQEIAEKALAEAAKGIPMATTAKELADEAILGMNEAKTRLDELEQKMVRQRDEVETAFKSLGERVTDDENVKAFLTQTGKGRVGVEIEQKAIISALGTNAAGSAGAAIVPQRIPGVQGLANRPLRVRDLLTPGQTTSNSIQFVQETAFTNAAASVSETSGATKAQSDLQLNAGDPT